METESNRDLEGVPWLASHKLEGAVEEGAGVAEGGGVVVDDHNVEKLGLTSHGGGKRARAERREAKVGGEEPRRRWCSASGPAWVGGSPLAGRLRSGRSDLPLPSALALARLPGPTRHDST